MFAESFMESCEFVFYQFLLISIWNLNPSLFTKPSLPHHYKALKNSNGFEMSLYLQANTLFYHGLIFFRRLESPMSETKHSPLSTVGTTAKICFVCSFFTFCWEKKHACIYNTVCSGKVNPVLGALSVVIVCFLFAVDGEVLFWAFRPISRLCLCSGGRNHLYHPILICINVFDKII